MRTRTERNSSRDGSAGLQGQVCITILLEMERWLRAWKNGDSHDRLDDEYNHG